MVVKESEPTLHEELATLFANPTTVSQTAEDGRVHDGRLDGVGWLPTCRHCAAQPDRVSSLLSASPDDFE